MVLPPSATLGDAGLASGDTLAARIRQEVEFRDCGFLNTWRVLRDLSAYRDTCPPGDQGDTLRLNPCPAYAVLMLFNV